MKKKNNSILFKIVFITLFAIILYFFITCYQVVSCSKMYCETKSDAILVLGAAAYNNNPSPVFRERINHAINLYKRKCANKIIFTGGKHFAKDKGESIAANSYAIKMGIPQSAILLEKKSKNTYQNLYYSLDIASQYNLKSFLLVSDPIHMKRASLMAQDMNLHVNLSPTPTTRFVSKDSKRTFFINEIWDITLYRISKILVKSGIINEHN